MNALTPVLSNPKTIINITGHSLGCALSLVLGYELIKMGRAVRIINFAPPRAGNNAFKSVFSDTEVINVINTQDLIPTLPPTYIVADEKLYQYVTIGKSFYFDNPSTNIIGCHDMVTYYYPMIALNKSIISESQIQNS
jgi:predicted lipase